MSDETLIQKILDIEWRMFRRVKSATPVVCQNSPDTFRKVRSSIFDLWTTEMLQSYLNDLKTAQNLGRNLLTEKYARMDDLLGPLKNNPLIEKIVAIETKWQEEIRQHYPVLYGVTCRSTDPSGDGSNFSIYLRCELETYGDQTIALYYRQVKSAMENRENLALRMLLQLVRKGGFSDLNQAEVYFRQQRGL
ncbi:MAG: DUF4125 family protein [Deltaproteobacteria bacterium]|nr:DUF4125 family protein [Deltaproteobacteria bacterium]